MSNRCRHYSGPRFIMGLERCRADIHIDNLNCSTRRDIPCLGERNRKALCSRLDALTDNEIAEESAQLKKMADETVKQMTFFYQLKKDHQPGTEGTTECPLCAAPFHFAIASSNGHLWGRCETEHCLHVME